MGPLHTKAAVKEFTEGLAEIKAQVRREWVVIGGYSYNNRKGTCCRCYTIP